MYESILIINLNLSIHSPHTFHLGFEALSVPVVFKLLDMAEWRNG